MKKNSLLLIAVLIIAALFFSGCGGGGGGTSSSAPDNNAEQGQNNNNNNDSNSNSNNTDTATTTPETVTENLTEESAYYVPYQFTDAQLIEMAKAAVPAESFDVSLLSDDNEEDEFATLSAYNPYAFNLTELTDEQKAKRAKKIVTAMWKHAVKLAVFPNSVDVPYKLQFPYNPNMKLQNTTTSHGTNAEATTQKRFLYVYPSFGDRTTVERFPYKQYTGSNEVYKWNSNGCTHEIMGTDCVGFVYHCVYDATKNYEVDDVKINGVKQKGARMRFYPDGSRLGNPENWKRTGLFPNAKRITDTSQPPKPGDILVWDGHVGMAVRIDYNTIGIAHSTGRTSGPYTCAEYAKYAQEDIYGGNNYSEESFVNGFVVHKYSDYTTPGKGLMGSPERWRVRLEETERSDEYDDDIIAKLTGTWKPVDAKLIEATYEATTSYVQQGSDNAVLTEKEYNFVKFNPNDTDLSSSLTIDVSVDKKINELNVKEYFISSKGKIVAARSLGGGSWAAVSQEDIFNYKDSLGTPGPFHVSDDKLVNQTVETLWYGSGIRTTTVSFPDTSTMQIICSLRGQDGNGIVRSDWIIELERADGTEKPEEDLWLKKLSGDWEPVDYSYIYRRDDYEEKKDIFIPYNPNNEDEYSTSSPKITITPKRVLNWYEVSNIGHIVATDTEGTPIVNMTLFEYPIYVSDDVMLQEFSSGNEPTYYKSIVSFPDNNSMIININVAFSDVTTTETYIELKRK